MMTMIKRLWNDEEAANAVEYGLITAVIAVALIGILVIFKGALQQKFQDSSDAVTAAPMK
jgi:Flp pilus assembly pilin Flp